MKKRPLCDLLLTKNDGHKKIVNVMKISGCLLFLSVFTLFAGTTNSQNAKVNLSQSRLSIGEFIEEVEKQTDYLFVYSKNEVKTDKSVTIETGNKPVSQYLNEVFNNTDITYLFENDYILLTKNSLPSVQQQKIVVTGTITDHTGEGVIGANVVEKGTTNGTITDYDGKYSLNVSPNATLLFSYIGYLSKEMAVNNRKTIDVELKEDSQTLDEIVVVGYGVQRKSDVTGSISVTGSDELLKGITFNALEGLRGKASGVSIMSNSGQPGGGQRVLIRGMGNINTSSDPLYVVDGVVMEGIQYLNPNDIERIEVLKDASSAAIYGARGANGVILVTTKRGLQGEGVRISYSGTVSISTMSRYMDMMNSGEWMQAFKQSIENYNKWYANSNNPDLQPISTDLSTYFTDPIFFNADGSPIYDTDWQRESTRNAISHSHQINIQQGGANSQVGAFLNYTDQQGLMLNTYLKRLNAKLTYDAKPTHYLSTAINLMVNHTWGNEAMENGSAMYPRRTMVEMLPWLPVYMPDGSYTNSYSITDNLGLEGMANPVHALTTQERMRYRTQIFGNAAFTFHLLPGLDLKTQIGMDAHLDQNRFYTPNDLVDLSYPDGQVTYNDHRYHYWQEETYLTYMKTFDKHRVNAMAGLSWQERIYRTHMSSRKGYTDNYSGSDNIGAGTIAVNPTSDYQRWAMNSYFIRGAYTYNDRYSATVTGRVDGSSKFGKNNKYAFFPSFGVAWNVSNEEFMKNISFIDQLKIHTSYGMTGNSEISTYQSLATIESGTALVNGSYVPTSHTNRLPNPDLKWETTGMWDIGFNLNMFGNRLNFDISYYLKKTKDLLLNRPVPHTTGYSSVMDNIGKVQNQGIDFMVNSVNIDTRNFEWSTTLNFNYNKNKILKLGDNNEDIITGPSNMSILRVGESLGAFWGFKRHGVWTEAERDQALAAGQNVGESKHSESEEIIGKGFPDLTGSFINTFKYRNFDLTVDMQFVLGVDIYQHYIHSTEDRFGKANGLRSILYDGYNDSNPNTMVQAVRNSSLWNHGSLSRQDSGWICDGSYLRGNLIQLGYTFDKKLAKKMKIDALRIDVSVNNFFLLCSSDFKGYDPEGSTHMGDYYQTFGQNVFFYQYPKPRTYTLGINITF